MASLVANDCKGANLSANQMTRIVLIVAIVMKKSSRKSFFEITISKGDPYATSDEEDVKLLQAALESAYTCLPFKQGRGPAERSSYFFCWIKTWWVKMILVYVPLCYS